MDSKGKNMGYMEHALTQRMTSVVNGLKQKYTSLYNTRDFIGKIRYLSKCDKDERGTVRTELNRMFEKFGVVVPINDGSPEYYIQLMKENHIPTPSEMTHSVYESFLDEFIQNPFPLPEEYIDRMVQGKIENTWGNDTLRVKILKKFIWDADYLSSAGYSDRYIKSYAKKKTGKKEPSLEEVVNSIDDGIFSVLNEEDEAYKLAVEPFVIEREKLKEEQKLRKVEVENELVKTIGKKSIDFKIRLSNALDKDVVYSDCSKKLADIRSRIANEQKKRKQKVNNKGKLGLLKIADDLATGKFGNPDVVREEIYLFAIVFELTYFSGDPEEIVTEETKSRNIETVMFGDYYANNLMRYISNSHEHINRGGEEQDPSGKGINYKNYMEVIFLYYLRRTDLNISEKLKRIYEMADEVHKSYAAIERAEKTEIENATEYYSSSFKTLEVEDEDEFKAFLLENYDCSIAPSSTPVFSVEAERKTAVAEYKALLEDAEDYEIEEEDYKNRRIAFLENEMDVDNIREIHKKREEGKIDFSELDNKSKFDILLYEVNRDLGKRKNLNELERGIVTRNDILRIYYQMFLSECSAEEDESLRSFSDVYEEFTYTANRHLSDAYLRPITGRDLYDLILIYSAYCNVNADKMYNF